jgi:hypothetical protein
MKRNKDMLNFPWRSMKQNAKILLLLVFSAITLFGSGCVSEPGIDKGKFAELNRIARDLQTSLPSGKPCEVPDAVLQRLASGTDALKDRTASKAERDLIKAYANLLMTYQDGLLLCRYRTHLTQFKFVPRGRIYVFQELDPIVQKYDLTTESHLYRPTGLYWRSIPEDSIAVIWKSAENQLRNIENMVNYN